jgi:hypothetical protein
VLSITSKRERNEHRLRRLTDRVFTARLEPAEEAYPPQFSERAIRFVFLDRNAGQKKGLPACVGGPFEHCNQNGGSFDSVLASPDLVRWTMWGLLPRPRN